MSGSAGLRAPATHVAADGQRWQVFDGHISPGATTTHYPNKCASCKEAAIPVGRPARGSFQRDLPPRTRGNGRKYACCDLCFETFAATHGITL